MFERNRVDNASVDTVAVEITLAGGEVVTGRAALPESRAVHKLMQGADPFLYIEQYSGEGSFVPKASIVSVNVLQPIRIQPLYPKAAGAPKFDPYRALGLTAGVTPGEIKDAYHRLTKLYHPDVYAGASLPPEVVSYLDGRAKEINAAYRLLKPALSKP